MNRTATTGSDLWNLHLAPPSSRSVQGDPGVNTGYSVLARSNQKRHGTGSFVTRCRRKMMVRSQHIRVHAASWSGSVQGTRDPAQPTQASDL